jgi:hypothetical protein
MSGIEVLRVSPFQQLQAAGELGLGGVEDEVEVRRHQAERVHRPAVTPDALSEEPQEVAAVVVVAEDRASVHAA